MWKRITLRVRIYIILAALVFTTLMGGVIMMWYTHQMQHLFTCIVDRNVAAFQAAEALETALVNQKGFVSYFFLDGDPDWLRQLERYRQIFQERLDQARSLVETTHQEEAIGRIEAEYRQYIEAKDRVIAYYKAGQREEGSRLHSKIRDRFFRILELCQNYKRLHTERIKQVRELSRAQAENLRFFAGSAMFMVLFLAVLMGFVLVYQILGPLKRLAVKTDRDGTSSNSGDEVTALSRSVHGLLEEYDHTQFELVKSRDHLVQAEKLALVGKLAAGMAHSIRNPLTSVKMRLFSLGRTLDLSAPQKEDFDVISDEIRHIDTIVENFLEFSRPPRLKVQRVSPSDIVDSAVKLLEHRIRSYEVNIDIIRQRRLSEIQGDPEQLKEVLVNLVVNACEAMEGGGSIVISEEEGLQDPFGRCVIIRLADNGPGIAKAIREKVLQPFFSTKEEGTGLGLSIASRIVEQHGGKLEFISEEGQGTTFTIALPLQGAGP